MWIDDEVTPYYRYSIKLDKILFRGKTKYQEIIIGESTDWGKVLILDGRIQITTKDEHCYHEPLIHPAMLTHKNPKRVLIIGGGDGGPLKHVLKYPVDLVTHVEVDDLVVEYCKKYIPELSTYFEDPRVELIFCNGRRFLEKNKREYDVIIVDITDPIEGGQSYPLFTQEFYKFAFNSLAFDGVITTQAESPYFYTDLFGAIYNTVGSVFPITFSYMAYVPSFGEMWGYVIGSKKHNPVEVPEEQLKSEINGIGTEYYTEKIHKKIFALPKDLERKITNNHTILKDTAPILLLRREKG